jgi:NAD(P)-dependent dehydrogenase (short-subunit alcohol dehydrogenase family)/acyl carrier protein
LSASAWREVLLESGFQSLEISGLADQGERFISAPSVIVAQNDSAPPPVEATARHWLVLADSAGIARGVVQRLEARGDSCTLVKRATDYERKGDADFSLDPRDPEHFRRLVDQAKSPLPLGGVIHLWSLDDADSEELTTRGLEQSFVSGLGSSVFLIQALNRRQPSSPPAVWFVTRGAVAVGESPRVPGLSQSMLWGLGKTIALEYPALWGGLIDLAPRGPDDAAIDAVVRAVSQTGHEEFVALRDHTLYRARIVRDAMPLPALQDFHPGATYLITGGLGSLGMKLASWMCERGAQHIVLVGRRRPSLRARARIARLRSAGCDIQVMQADVTDAEALRRVFAHVETSAFPLRGVIHAAGAGRFAEIGEADVDSLTAEMRPKVIGGWVLHELTKRLKLDFFVSFSSMVALWGAKGQGAYAAANQFLDTLAHYRRSLGLPGLSINWGLWASDDRAGLIAQMAPLGVRALRPRMALETFGSLVLADVGQIAVADIDWDIFKRLYETRRRRPLFERISVNHSSPAARKEASYRAQLEQAPLAERFRLLRSCIASELAAVVGLSPASVAEGHQGFFDLGMDSLMAVEFKNRLENRLDCRCPSTLAFDHPTVDDLTRHLFGEILHWDLAQATAHVPRETEQPDPVLEVSQLSSEQVEDSITRELTELEAMLRPGRGVP